MPTTASAVAAATWRKRVMTMPVLRLRSSMTCVRAIAEGTCESRATSDNEIATQPTCTGDKSPHVGDSGGGVSGVRQTQGPAHWPLGDLDNTGGRAGPRHHS